MRKVFVDSHPLYIGVTAPAALTDSTGGTVSSTLAVVPASYTQATLANQLASLNAQVNLVITALKSVGIIQ